MSIDVVEVVIWRESSVSGGSGDRKSGSAGMPRPISYAVFCLKKKIPRNTERAKTQTAPSTGCSDSTSPSSFNSTPTTQLYALSLHDALPIYIMVTLHEVITFLVSMQISISSLQTHNVNRCGRSRHLARKLSLRRKR